MPASVMKTLPSKEALKNELKEILERALETATRAQKTTHEAATHAEAKPENDKDTRALEQSYLARGQAKRVVELTSALRDVVGMKLRSFAEDDIVALSAVVETTEDDDAERVLFMCPGGGGTSLAQGQVQVTTPDSPLGQALLGKTAGEAIEVTLAGKKREIEIIRVW